jgi:hypothetical protein
MSKNSESEIVNELESMIEKIMKAPPAEINNINDATSVPGMHRYGWIIQLNTMLSNTCSFLGMLNSSAKEGIPIDSIIPITIKRLEHDIIVTVSFGFNSTTDLLKKVITALRDVHSVDEYSKIVTRLSIYLGKLGHVGWIDLLLLHAADMALIYELLFPPTDYTKT